MSWVTTPQNRKRTTGNTKRCRVPQGKATMTRAGGRGGGGLELQDLEAVVEKQTLYVDQDKTG